MDYDIRRSLYFGGMSTKNDEHLTLNLHTPIDFHFYYLHLCAFLKSADEKSAKKGDKNDFKSNYFCDPDFVFGN